MLLSLIWVFIQVQLINAKPYDSPLYDTHSCMDLFKSGERNDGYYQIVGKDSEIWIVYCDFQSELGSVWTLVMSWSFANKDVLAFDLLGLTMDAPLNELSPNWEVYRMSKDQMVFLKARSTHWRVTCSYDTMDIDYRDYLRGNFAEFDITSYVGGGVCKNIDYINVRGHVGHQDAAFWQTDGVMFHTDSHYTGCKFNANAGSKKSEDNFGHYGNANPFFRCSSDSTATTQYWFGSYI